MKNEKDHKHTIEFVPGCFDDFEGTQEELDDLITEITKMANDGTMEKNAIKLDMDDLSDDDLRALEVLDRLFEDEDEDELFDDLVDRRAEARKKKLN